MEMWTRLWEALLDSDVVKPGSKITWLVPPMDE